MSSLFPTSPCFSSGTTWATSLEPELKTGQACGEDGPGSNLNTSPGLATSDSGQQREAAARSPEHSDEVLCVWTPEWSCLCRIGRGFEHLDPVPTM